MILIELNLQKKAFEQDEPQCTLSEWVAVNQQKSPMFSYWYNVLQSIKAVLLIVRSFRDANIDLLIVALEKWHHSSLLFIIYIIHAGCSNPKNFQYHLWECFAPRSIWQTPYPGEVIFEWPLRGYYWKPKHLMRTYF